MPNYNQLIIDLEAALHTEQELNTGYRDQIASLKNAPSLKMIAKALDFALRYGGIDGAHHKTWVIDQMVRALTGCPMENFIGTDCRGNKYECDVQGAGDEYIEWVRNARAGEDGPETYDWDTGIPP